MSGTNQTVGSKGQVSRRGFLAAAAAAGVAAPLVLTNPRVARAATAVPSTRPASRVNIALIGTGGKAGDTIRKMTPLAGVNVVGLCDVFEPHLADPVKRFPGAKVFRDYRKMLETLKEIDGVVVTVPDHTHAPAACMAMRLGKHVYCEKPLTHDIYEARQMRLLAEQYKLATQMGNEGRASEESRRVVEWVQGGALGNVTEVHAWTDRAKGWWPQGMTRPPGEDPVPANVDWDLWLGSAPQRPFLDKYKDGQFKGKSVYQPFVWRGWWDFGTGALGDIACHVLDPVFWALDLCPPTSVEAQHEGVTADAYPLWSIINYQIPARPRSDGKAAQWPALKLTWYDGAKLPPIIAEVYKDDPKLYKSSGIVLVGDQGTLVSGIGGPTHLVAGPRAADKQYKGPDPWLPRSVGHHLEWIDAIRGGPAPGSNFSRSGRLTEIVLTGNLAIRLNKRIDWDGEAMTARNAPEADALVKREYRKGWEL